MATAKASRAVHLTTSIATSASHHLYRSCRQRLVPFPLPLQRAFSSSHVARDQDDNIYNSLGYMSPSSQFRNAARNKYKPDTTSINDILDASQNSLIDATFADQGAGSDRNEPHRLHVYSTKHNTHITFVQPAKSAAETASSGVSGTSASSKDQKKMVDVLLSLSAGNIGFRKAGRGSYDAAYQVAAFALRQMQEKGMLRDVQSLQVVMRGFGAGREAVTKVILGSEGRFIRNRITSVVDATRLKQGGPRGKKPRRLG